MINTRTISLLLCLQGCSFLLLLSSPARVMGADLVFELNYDRPGGALISHRQGVSRADQCAAFCQDNPACVAFTWVKPGVQSPIGDCWLKSSLSEKVAHSCCVSGVVRPVKEDECKWNRSGATYTCNCQSSATGGWYQTNPSACTGPKPNPVYGGFQPEQGPGTSVTTGAAAENVHSGVNTPAAANRGPDISGSWDNGNTIISREGNRLIARGYGYPVSMLELGYLNGMSFLEIDIDSYKAGRLGKSSWNGRILLGNNKTGGFRWVDCDEISHGRIMPIPGHDESTQSLSCRYGNAISESLLLRR